MGGVNARGGYGDNTEQMFYCQARIIVSKLRTLHCQLRYLPPAIGYLLPFSPSGPLSTALFPGPDPA